MSRRFTNKLVSLQSLSLFLVASLVLVGLLALSNASGDPLPIRSLMLSTALPSATDSYTLGFRLPNNETLGSIELQICSDGPLYGTPCTPPTGFDMSAMTLGTQNGETGFTIQSVTSNSVIFGRTPAAASGGESLSYELNNIKNPPSPGAYYGRIQTFATSDGSGPNTDFGGLAFDINNSLQVSTVVPPYLYFCVGVTITGVNCSSASGDYINFGNFSTALASAADSQMVAGTNADTGYNIIVSGNTLTSGNNTIPALGVQDVSRPGTSQFGINLVANQDPQVGQNPGGTGNGSPTGAYNQANRYKFVPNDTIVSVPLPDEPRNYTVSYIANIAKAQSPGIYVTTLTYVATANF